MTKAFPRPKPVYGSFDTFCKLLGHLWNFPEHPGILEMPCRPYVPGSKTSRPHIYKQSANFQHFAMGSLYRISPNLYIRSKIRVNHCTITESIGECGSQPSKQSSAAMASNKTLGKVIFIYKILVPYFVLIWLFKIVWRHSCEVWNNYSCLVIGLVSGALDLACS